ncbi:PREDICTED: uncharacterized protein LOC104801147 [Tarenaya hassleriana]|uniref:uncharacterized protein LOC104801147 n=1 Tax=Tarenaya hassleriana TaxID=28532 RepID=UPI00053CA29B|nr:PREDICTED: uncharacterized protein LOC104801147 [Tarenaya hassleriana]
MFPESVELKTTMETEHDMMEAPGEAISSSLGKRKADAQGESSGDESGGSESSGDGEIGEGGSSSDELTAESGSSSPTENKVDDSHKWEWGYDSFDDLQYESPPEDVFSDEESSQKYRAYIKQYFEHRGFYIDPENIFPGQIGGIFPYPDADLDTDYAKPGKTERQHAADLSKEALQMYNKINGTDVTLERVVRVNMAWGFKVKSYITILAKENPDEPSVEYQVMTKRRIKQKDRPIFCRPAPSK